MTFDPMEEYWSYQASTHSKILLLASTLILLSLIENTTNYYSQDEENPSEYKMFAQ